MNNSVSRRLALKTVAAATVMPVRASLGNEGPQSDQLPPVRTITRGPQHHWFGYYDKREFDPTNRFVLSNQVDFEGRTPTADDVIRVGMIDTANNDQWIELGFESRLGLAARVHAAVARGVRRSDLERPRARPTRLSDLEREDTSHAHAAATGVCAQP